MLGQPCPQCGGIRVRYKGKVYCTEHENISAVAASEPLSFAAVVESVREVLTSKINEAVLSLSSEKDLTRQDQIASLLAKYFELIQELPPAQERA